MSVDTRDGQDERRGALPDHRETEGTAMPKLPHLALTIALWLPVAGLCGPIQNPDFAAGFAGWSGELLVDDLNPNLLPTDPSADARFEIDGGGLATLFTGPSSDPATRVFWTFLYQEFDMPASATGIDFDYAWSVTNTNVDLPGAMLVWDGGLLVLDLFDLAGVLIPFEPYPDVRTGRATASFATLLPNEHPAGARVRLEFSIADGDGTTDGGTRDQLQIGNIVIATPASAPASLLLLVPGLALLLGRRRTTATATRRDLA
jgi:hypothetical protein